MSATRIDRRFNELKAQGRAALVTFAPDSSRLTKIASRKQDKRPASSATA
jgi:hypothetical protein